jgi:hypothetical protein
MQWQARRREPDKRATLTDGNLRFIQGQSAPENEDHEPEVFGNKILTSRSVLASSLSVSTSRGRRKDIAV